MTQGPGGIGEFLTTREVAMLLRVKERKIYELASGGAIPCRRITGKLLFPRAEIVEWLAGARADAERRPALPNVVAGSHDPLLEWAIRQSGCGLATLFNGSLDGLQRLEAGDALAAGLHIHESGQGGGADGWNVRHVAASAAASSCVLVGWATRQQGLILSRSGAGDIGSVADLAGKRVVQRQPTAGSQILLNHLMSAAGIGEDQLLPVSGVAHTESDVASLIASGKAEAAPGLKAVADQFGLAFVPTLRERFELLVDRRSWFDPPFQKLLAFCRTPAFRDKAEELGGYALDDLASVRWNG
jgi:putative molybdopterin biosynthesis protein